MKIFHRTITSFVNNYKAAGLVAACMTFASYLSALNNGFVNWDDDVYVYENLHIQSFNLNFLEWAFTSYYFENWHPLTIISYALDYAVWGLNPFGFHLTNIIFHALNTFLVFILVIRLIECGSTQLKTQNFHLVAASVTSLLFGIHPLHVESVAWISERKDVLCAFFYLSSILSYLKYALPTSSKKKIHYSLSLLFFIMASMSKPMAVSLPIVLMVLDLSLKRLTSTGALKKLLVEKIPFLLFSIFAAAATIGAQHSMMGKLDAVSHKLNPSDIMHSYFLYIQKIVFPFNLVPYYKYRLKTEFLNIEQLFSFIIVLFISFYCIRSFKKHKTVFYAWLYYTVTLMPVIAIVPIADRYAYLPGLGPFFLMGTGIAIIIEKRGVRSFQIAAMSSVIILLISLSAGTVRQASVWHDSATLWSHEIRQFPETADFAYYSRGLAYIGSGNYPQAIKDFNRAVEINPGYEEAYYNLGSAYLRIGNRQEAINNYTIAIGLDPKDTDAYNSRANLYFDSGDLDRAIADFNTAIGIDPANAELYSNLGVLYHRMGNYQKAFENFDRAVGIDPQFSVAYYNQGLIYSKLGYPETARIYYKKAAGLGLKEAQDILAERH